jgi:predicted TIM-barrel fold metal-dependent hydrolase
MAIDTHSQLWTKEAIESFPREMAEGYKNMFKDIGFPKMEDAIKDMDDAGVEQSVVVAVDAETTFHYKVSNDLVAESVKKFPGRLIGFASIDPNKGVLGVDELSRAVKGLGLRGLKILPHLVKMSADDPRMYPLYETAQDLGIPVLFHMGTQFHAGTKLKYCRPLAVDEVAVDFPRLKLVIAHFGFPWFYETIAVVQRNPNVFFNIAGWAPRHIHPDVIRYMSGPLKGRALFGSDYPLITRVRIVKELRELNIAPDVLRLLMEENPKRLLGIG